MDLEACILNIINIELYAGICFLVLKFWRHTASTFSRFLNSILNEITVFPWVSKGIFSLYFHSNAIVPVSYIESLIVLGALLALQPHWVLLGVTKVHSEAEQKTSTSGKATTSQCWASAPASCRTGALGIPAAWWEGRGKAWRGQKSVEGRLREGLGPGIVGKAAESYAASRTWHRSSWGCASPEAGTDPRRPIEASRVLHGVREQMFLYPKETLAAAQTPWDSVAVISALLFWTEPGQHRIWLPISSFNNPALANWAILFICITNQCQPELEDVPYRTIFQSNVLQIQAVLPFL